MLDHSYPMRKCLQTSDSYHDFGVWSAVTVYKHGKNTSKVNKLNGLGRSQAKLSHCGFFVQLKKCRDKKLLKFDLSTTLFWVLPKNIDNDWGDLTLLFFPFLIDPYPNCGPTIASKYCFCWKPHGWLSSSFSKAAAQTLSKKITWAEKLYISVGKTFHLGNTSAWLAQKQHLSRPARREKT